LTFHCHCMVYHHTNVSRCSGSGHYTITKDFIYIE
jgi:hypothetical protein